MIRLFTRAAFAGALAALALTGTAGAQSADSYNRHVQVINNTSHVMMQFYASNTGTDSWEEDILGSGTLASGSSVDINIDDGTGYCRYDMKAVFDDGSEQVIPRVNVCAVATATFTD